MLLSIIIVNWNTRDLLYNCLQSLSLSAHPNWDVFVVDNGSSDGSPEMVRENFPGVHVIVNASNRGFGAANNQGIAASRGEYVLLLNSDTEAPPGALEAMLAFLADHPTAAAAGPRLQQPNGAAQPFAFGSDPSLRYLVARGFTAVARNHYLHDWNTDEIQKVDWVSGACLLVRRAAIEQVGVLDEDIFMYFEDNDWCLRLRQAGWEVYYYPLATVKHIGGQSLARNPQAGAAYRRSLRYFYHKHYDRVHQWMLEPLLLGYDAIARATR